MTNHPNGLIPKTDYVGKLLITNWYGSFTIPTFQKNKQKKKPLEDRSMQRLEQIIEQDNNNGIIMAIRLN